MLFRRVSKDLKSIRNFAGSSADDFERGLHHGYQNSAKGGACLINHPIVNRLCLMCVLNHVCSPIMVARRVVLTAVRKLINLTPVCQTTITKPSNILYAIVTNP